MVTLRMPHISAADPTLPDPTLPDSTQPDPDPDTLQSCCTERSNHTYARVPADLAQAPDGRGKVEGGSGECF